MNPFHTVLAAVTVAAIGTSTTEGSETNAPATRSLETITVTGERYRIEESSTATKTNTDLMYAPVSIQAVTRDVLDDQQAIRPVDALRNVSGVQPDFGFGGLRDRAMIRGFSTDNFPQGGSYVDGVLQFEATNSLANIERVEVLKGAAAMLFGRIEPGGLINYVTKRPQNDSYYALQQQVGSNDNYRTTLDATSALIDDTLMYRLNAEYIDADSFRDYVHTDRMLVAPSLTWKISERTQLDFDYVYQDEEAHGDYGLPAIGDGIADIPVERFTGEPEHLSTTRVNQGSLTLTHGFNAAWSVRAKYAKYKMEGQLLETVMGYLDETTGIGDRWYYQAPNGIDSDFATADLTGQFTTGSVKHTLLVGADYYDRTYHEDGVYVDLWYTANGLTPSPIDIYAPVYGYDVGAMLEGQPRAAYQPSDEWFGVYLQDQMAIGDHWQLLVGARFDDAHSEQSRNFDRTPEVETDDDAFSPRVGLVYQPRDNLSMYASFAQSFNGPNIGVNADDGSGLDSQTSEQYEVGVKMQALDDRLLASAAIFDLTKQNIAQPVTPIPGEDEYALTGEARSRGLEVDVGGQISDHWQVIATYTYLDAEYTDDIDAQGNRMANVPEHMGSLWTTLRGEAFGVPRLMLGGGMFFVGDRYGDEANSFELPSYVRVDATVGYALPVAQSVLHLQLNVENLLDERYFVSAAPRGYASRVGITPGAPRSLLASVRFEF